MIARRPRRGALGQATDGIWTRWWCGSQASGEQSSGKLAAGSSTTQAQAAVSEVSFARPNAPRIVQFTTSSTFRRRTSPPRSTLRIFRAELTAQRRDGSQRHDLLRALYLGSGMRRGIGPVYAKRKYDTRQHRPKNPWLQPAEPMVRKLFAGGKRIRTIGPAVNGTPAERAPAAIAGLARGSELNTGGQLVIPVRRHQADPFVIEGPMVRKSAFLQQRVGAN